MIMSNKKVLILSASPRRKGNSDILCDQFLLGANEAGHDAEKIFIRDKKINFCVACGACQKNGGTCVQKDDMAEILEKMLAADVIVMATPVYFYTMNGQMKTLIDRTYAKYPNINNKDIYFIVTAADGRKQAIDRVIEEFRGFTDCYSSINEKGIICGVGAWAAGEIMALPAMQEAYEMGQNV